MKSMITTNFKISYFGFKFHSEIPPIVKPFPITDNTTFSVIPLPWFDLVTLLILTTIVC